MKGAVGARRGGTTDEEEERQTDRRVSLKFGASQQDADREAGTSGGSRVSIGVFLCADFLNNLNIVQDMFFFNGD